MVLTLLTLLMVSVAEAADNGEQALPLGFLEFLGGMVEVEGVAEKTLLDPLDFESVLDPESFESSSNEEEAEHIEEVSL